MNDQKLLSQLTARLRKNQRKFIKNTLLIGYTPSMLNEYLTAYASSTLGASVVREDFFDTVVDEYKSAPPNSYLIFSIVGKFVKYLCFEATVKIHHYEDYDDAYAFLESKIPEEVPEDEKHYIIMVMKVDESVCETIHKEIQDLTAVRDIRFKPEGYGIKLWLRFDRTMDKTEIEQRIKSLGKHNTHDSWVNGSMTNISTNIMIVHTNDFRRFIKLKLTHPWVFAEAFKITYGTKLIIQKLNEID